MMPHSSQRSRRFSLSLSSFSFISVSAPPNIAKITPVEERSITSVAGTHEFNSFRTHAQAVVRAFCQVWVTTLTSQQKSCLNQREPAIPSVRSGAVGSSHRDVHCLKLPAQRLAHSRHASLRSSPEPRQRRPHVEYQRCGRPPGPAERSNRVAVSHLQQAHCHSEKRQMPHPSAHRKALPGSPWPHLLLSVQRRVAAQRLVSTYQSLKPCETPTGCPETLGHAR